MTETITQLGQLTPSDHIQSLRESEMVRHFKALKLIEDLEAFIAPKGAILNGPAGLHKSNQEPIILDNLIPNGNEIHPILKEDRIERKKTRRSFRPELETLLNSGWSTVKELSNKLKIGKPEIYWAISQMGRRIKKRKESGQSNMEYSLQEETINSIRAPRRGRQRSPVSISSRLEGFMRKTWHTAPELAALMNLTTHRIYMAISQPNFRHAVEKRTRADGIKEYRLMEV